MDIKLDEIPESSMWMIESALMTLRRHGAAGTAQGSADAAIDQHRPVADAEGQLVGALRQELDSLRKLNPFQILGVGYEASDEAVRAAFGELTKSYHPDRFARYESQEARKVAAEIFILIRNAYQSLNTAEGRAKIAAALRDKSQRAAPVSAEPRAATPPPVPETTPPVATPPPVPETPPRAATPPPVPDASATPEPVAPEASEPGTAAGRYARAEALLEAGRYDEASVLYTLAAKRDPDDAEAQIGLELAEGFKALADRDRLEAAQRFEAVLELDPSNERAARVLAEMRRRATEERKGHLSRLLGKKG